MDSETYDQFLKKSDAELFSYTTEKEHSQKRRAAEHILEMRRNAQLVEAAKDSALAAQESVRAIRESQKTARWAMIAAIVSAFAGVVSVLRGW